MTVKIKQLPRKHKLNVQKINLIKVRNELKFTFKINFYSKVLKILFSLLLELMRFLIIFFILFLSFLNALKQTFLVFSVINSS